MATAAFRSTTKRSSAAADAGSSNRAGVHRRSRSLSRFRLLPPDAEEPTALAPPPRGRFVNTARGSGFPELSLDDLADEFFAAGDVEEVEAGRGGGRSGRRLSDAGFRMETESSRRRGRSVSRQGSLEDGGGVKGVCDGQTRRRRSVSVARHRCSDSETEHSGRTGVGNGLYEVMHKEARYAVEDIRTELEKVMVKMKPVMKSDRDGVQPKDTEAFEAIAEIRRNYATKLEESEKRKQELLAELAAEEQRGQQLSKIVRELLPDAKQSSPERPLQFRKRSNDRTRIFKCLSEEAEKYIVDFISNVEDTDISSFDGDKSDGSSSIGRTKSSSMTGTQACLANSLPSEIDGLVFPWLEWETRNDGTPLLHNRMSKMGDTLVLGTRILHSKQEANGAHDDSMYSNSSHGSWSPHNNVICSTLSKHKPNSRLADAGSHLNSGTKVGHRGTLFEWDDYIHLKHTEDFLFESLQQRQRIESGGLILCRRSYMSH